MAPAEALRAAAALLADPSAWCRDARARDAADRSCDPGSVRAVRWCAHGALRRVTPRGEARDLAIGHLADAADHFFGTSPEDVNDGHGHAATLEMFGHAVAFAERAEIH